MPRLGARGAKEAAPTFGLAGALHYGLGAHRYLLVLGLLPSYYRNFLRLYWPITLFPQDFILAIEVPSSFCLWSSTPLGAPRRGGRPPISPNPLFPAQGRVLSYIGLAGGISQIPF